MYARQTLLAALLLAGLSGGAYAQSTTPGTATPPAAAPTPTAPMTGSQKPAMPTMPTMPAKPSASAVGASRFTTEAEARAHCPGDKIVWANHNSKAFHLSGDRYFGKGKHGSYMCMAEATAAGYHKSGTHHARTHTGAASSTAKHS